MLNPNGRYSTLGVSSLSDGLIGFFPCETPLVNIVTPTYITDNASEDITTYNYAINRTANPSMITDIKGKMRWINKSKAIKGRVGTKMTGVYRQLPSLISEGYGCENDFSMTAIINKHGNFGLPIQGETSLYFVFKNIISNKEECLRLKIGTSSIYASYGEVDNDGNITELYREDKPTSLQIESPNINIERTGFYSYKMTVTDSLGELLFLNTIDNIRFTTTTRFSTSGKNEITNIRTYSRALTDAEHIEICKTGDCKSMYFIYSDDFLVEYNKSKVINGVTGALRAVSINSQNKYPLGTARVFSKAGFAVNDSARGFGDAVIEGIDGLGQYSSYNDPSVISTNLANKKSIYIDNIPSYIDIDNTSSPFFIVDNEINSSTEMLSSLSIMDFYHEIIGSNRSIFFGLVHHGYIFIEYGTTNKEYIKKITCDSTMNISTYLKYGTKILAPNEIITHDGVSGYQLSLNIDDNQLTGCFYRVYAAKLNYSTIYSAITGSLPITQKINTITISPTYANSSVIIQVYNSQGVIHFIKNIEFRTQSIIDISDTEYYNYHNSYCVYTNKNPTVQGHFKPRVQNNRGKEGMIVGSGSDYAPFYAIANTSYNSNGDMVVEFNTDKYSLSEFQSNLLTVYEESISSGALLNRRTVSKNVGTCTGVSYIYNEYMNENYSDTVVTPSGEVTVTEYNPIDLLTSKSNGIITISQPPASNKSLKIVFGQVSAGSPDLTARSVGDYVPSTTQTFANAIKIDDNVDNTIKGVFICFDGDSSFYRIEINNSNIVASKEVFLVRNSITNHGDVLNSIPDGKKSSIFGLYELIMTREDNGVNLKDIHISINSCDGSREYKMKTPILSANTYNVSTTINMPHLFEISEVENIGVIGTRRDAVFSKVRASTSNYMYFLPKPTVFMFTPSSLAAYNNTGSGQKYNSYLNKANIWGEQQYIEQNYNFTNTSAAITLSYAYGINRFVSVFSSNMIPDGYAWYSDDLADGSPDYDIFEVSIDENEEQKIGCYFPSGMKRDARIIFSLEHLVSVDRDVSAFPLSSLRIDPVDNRYHLILRIRHPISKRCLETPIIIETSESISSVIQSTSLIRNDNTINYLTYSSCMWDFDSEDTSPASSIIKNINSTKKILLLNGTSPYIVRRNSLDQTATVSVRGTGFSVFKVIKKIDTLPKLYYKKEYYNYMYKPAELREFCINGQIPVLGSNDYFNMGDIFSEIQNGMFSYYGIDSEYNWGNNSINIMPSENIMKQCSLDTTTSDYIPSLYLDDAWNIETFSSDIENDLYRLFEYITLNDSSNYYMYENQYSKSWICRIEIDGMITMDTQVSETEFTINCGTGTDFYIVNSYSQILKGTHSGEVTFNTDEVKYESYIITSKTSVGISDRYTVQASVIIPSFLKATSVYKSKENQYKVSKSNNDFSYVKNRLEYTVSDKSVAHTFEVTEAFDDVEKFLIKSYTSDDDWHIIDIKRNLGSIITTRTKTPSFSTYYGIKGWLTNNPVSVTPVGATVSLSAENLIWNVPVMTFVISKQNDRIISQSAINSIISMTGLDDYYYRLYVENDSGTLSPYTKDEFANILVSSTGSRMVSVVTLDNNLSLEKGFAYLNSYGTLIKFEIIEYYESEIKIIEDRIEYNKKYGGETTQTTVYANTKNGQEVLTMAFGSLLLTKDNLPNENNIQSLTFTDKRVATTYFGDDFIVRRTEIPYNNVEILSKVSDSCIDFYDFYGKDYKNYNKINLLQKAIVTECDVIENHRFGKYAKNITTQEINRTIGSIKQIVFLVKYDVLNLFNKTDSSFSISAKGDSMQEQIFLTDTNLNKDEKWQLISINITDNGDKFYITRYNESSFTWETIVPSTAYNGPYGFFKLSINNNRWLVCGLMVDSILNTQYAESILSRIKYEQSISLSDNKYSMLDGSYFYYNENPLYDVKKSDCITQYSSGNALTHTNFKYGKFQEIVNRQTSDDLILRDVVVSYRNIPNNKLISENEKLIGEDATSVSFDVYCQKLGVNELNNPVIFLSPSMSVIDEIPSDNIYYIGCLVDDTSDDAILVEQYTEKLIFTYNSFLPTTGHLYEEGSLAILGREVVALKRLLPTTVTNDNKKYVVLELDREYMNTSMYFNQKLPVRHFTGENIRSVYDFSSNITSYEFVDSMCDGENNMFNISRTGGNCVLKEEIYKFNKFTTLSGRYEVDKGCAMYLFEGNSDNTLLQSTMFIENISTDPKESEINISLKNKMDMIYDYNIINYKTLENISVLTAIKEIVFPYINIKENNNIVLSSAMYSIKDYIENIKTMELSAYTSVGEALDAICNCGYNIWIDENERFVIDTDMYSKQINNGVRVEYDNGMTSMNKVVLSGVNYYGYANCCNIDINGYNSLTDDFVISERDSLIVNKIDIDHENTVPMYERTEYVVGDYIYPINCLKIMSNVRYENYSPIVHLDKNGIVTPNVQEFSLLNAEFNSTKSKIGVMCVIRRGNYELQYKMIKVERES